MEQRHQAGAVQQMDMLQKKQWILLKERGAYSIWVCVHPPKERQNTLTRYSITEKNWGGEVREKPENYDLLSAVMIHLGEPDGENYDGALQLLDVLFSKETSLLEKQSVMEKEVSSMCNWSEGIWQSELEREREITMLNA